MGSAKAAVLPVPVCAWPMTSPPARRAGIVRPWTGVGASYPRAVRVWTKVSRRPREAKVDSGMRGGVYPSPPAKTGLEEVRGKRFEGRGSREEVRGKRFEGRGSREEVKVSGMVNGQW